VRTEIVQVRDVPSSDLAILRARAAARKMSLSSYLRALIHDDSNRPTMSETLARIAGRAPIEAGQEEIRALIDSDHR
jgi:hypothetical protein